MEKIFKKIKLSIIPTKKNKYRPYFLLSNFLFALVLVLFLLKLISFSFVCFFPRGFLFSAVNRSALLTLTNQKRLDFRISTLKENYKLNQAAYLKAKDMLSYNYFAHTSPSGKNPWYWLSKVGYDYQYAGENLAIDFVDSEELFQAWYSSSTHRANIINPKFQDIGMAVLSGNFKGRRTTVVVQYFGRKMSIPSAQAKEIKPKTRKTTQVFQKVARASRGKSVSTPGGITLYEYYKRKGKDLPSISKRAVLYEKLELGESSSYYGADWQNALLVNKLVAIDKKNLRIQKEDAEKVTKGDHKDTHPKKVIKKEEKVKPKVFEQTVKPETKKPTIKKPSFLSRAREKSNSIIVRFLNFFARNYNEITRITFLSVFIIVFASLCIDIFVKIRIQHKDIILRGTIYSLILLILFLLDESVIIKMIPHNLGIL